MTKTQLRRLLREVAQVAEQSYRRGFHQGFHVAKGANGRPVPLSAIIASWRFAMHSSQFAVGPPGSLWAGRRADLMHRLEMELPGDCMIRQLLAEVSDPAHTQEKPTC